MPTNYPYYPQPYPYYPPVQPTRSVVRKAELVQGRTAADVFQVSPGEEVFLIDEDNPYVYRKARGFDGIVQPMEIYDLAPHVEQEPRQMDLSDYITNEQLDAKIDDEIERRIREEVDRRLSEVSFTTAPKRSTAKKGE